MWTLSYGEHEDRTPTHGYEPTREAAMQAFRQELASGGREGTTSTAPVAAGSLGRPHLCFRLEKRILEAPATPGRPGVRKIAARFDVNPETVQRINRPFVAPSVALIP
jgi:hypothetical protein